MCHILEGVGHGWDRYGREIVVKQSKGWQPVQLGDLLERARKSQGYVLRRYL